MKQTVIVAQRLEASDADRALVERIIAAAVAHGHDVLLMPDLYCLPDDSTVWDELHRLPGPVTLWGWMHPRPLRWLLARHGVAADEWRLLDLRTVDETAGVPTPDAHHDEPGQVRRLHEPAMPRWYPVIDDDRCENCGHCLQFCLFDVYAHDGEQTVRVTQPDNCKPGCPACSRICPGGAIMFPMYDKDPAIAGAPDTTMGLDAAGRRLYYQRTRQPCPTCAQLSDEQLAHVAQDGCCPECARKLLQASPVLAEIDALIDRLDRLAERDK
jgi:Pyruvate/2-oxoacid:ferredoxin oxidoreductase delta subunit